jgi:hypothetical protein
MMLRMPRLRRHTSWNGRQLGATFEQLGLATQRQRRGKELIAQRLAEETLGRLAERGEVRDLGQPQDRSQVGPFREHRVDAPVVLAMELLDDQTGHKLRLRELLGTLGAGVVRQGVPRRS